MGCIETTVAYEEYVKVVTINSNMGCIETSIETLLCF